MTRSGRGSLAWRWWFIILTLLAANLLVLLGLMWLILSDITLTTRVASFEPSSPAMGHANPAVAPLPPGASPVLEPTRALVRAIYSPTADRSGPGAIAVSTAEGNTSEAETFPSSATPTAPDMAPDPTAGSRPETTASNPFSTAELPPARPSSGTMTPSVTPRPALIITFTPAALQSDEQSDVDATGEEQVTAANPTFRLSSFTPTRTLEPTATKEPSETATSTVTRTATRTRAPTRTSTATAPQTATSTSSPTATDTATSTLTPTQRPTSTREPATTPRSSSTPTESATVTTTPTVTATRTSRPSRTPTQRPTPTATLTPSPTRTTRPSQTPSLTPQPTEPPTRTRTASAAPTENTMPAPTETAKPTLTVTPRPSRTPTMEPTTTPSRTVRPRWTPTETAEPTVTRAARATATLTPTATATWTSTATETATRTVVPTGTHTPTATETYTATPSPTFSPTSSPNSTPIVTASATPIASPTETQTSTPIPTETASRTATALPTTSIPAQPSPEVAGTAAPTEDIDSIEPDSPVPPRVQVTTRLGGVYIRWDGEPGTRYRIYSNRGSPFDKYRLVADTAGQQWMDVTVEPGRTYRYEIIAYKEEQQADAVRITVRAPEGRWPLGEVPSSGAQVSTPSVRAEASPTAEALSLIIMSRYSYVDSGGQLHILALLRNNTASGLVDVTARVSLLDEAGQIIRTVPGYPYSRAVAAGETTLLHLILNEPSPTSFDIVADGTAGTVLLVPLRVDASQGSAAGDGFYYVAGRARNTGSARLNYPRLVVVLLDSRRRPVNAEVIQPVPSQIEPDDTATFQTRFDHFPGVTQHQIYFIP